MPDKQDQKKKDGGRKDKKTERMHEHVKESQEHADAVAADPHQRDPDEANRSGTKS